MLVSSNFAFVQEGNVVPSTLASTSNHSFPEFIRSLGFSVDDYTCTKPTLRQARVPIIKISIVLRPKGEVEEPHLIPLLRSFAETNGKVKQPHHEVGVPLLSVHCGCHRVYP